MSTTLAAAVRRILRKMNDEDSQFFSVAEVEDRLRDGYRIVAHSLRVFWDQTYLENLPRGFSFSAEFEEDFADLNYGRANHSAEFERLVFDNEFDADGPGTHTSPFEAEFDDSPIPALSRMPEDTVDVDRSVWDESTIDSISHRTAEEIDHLYESTQGEVMAIVFSKDGLHVARKIRIPSQRADIYESTGSYGIARQLDDIHDTQTGTWGVPRQIPLMHPMGYSGGWGLPRRAYRDGKNVRVEYFREGRPVEGNLDTFELPDRYVRYLEWYAMARLLTREGPAQDFKLAGHYNRRWDRGLARLSSRMRSQQRERISRMGGESPRARRGPPRPRLPWNYGKPVR